VARVNEGSHSFACNLLTLVHLESVHYKSLYVICARAVAHGGCMAVIIAVSEWNLIATHTRAGYGMGIVGRCLGPTTSEGLMKDGCKIF